MSETNITILEDLELISNSKVAWRELKNQTILVTGCSGLIGSYIVKSLLYSSKKYDLNIKIVGIYRSIDSLNKRLSMYLNDPNFKFVLHDVSEPVPDNLPEADFIIHAASQASPKYYGIDPVGTMSANVIGTRYLLNHAIKSRSKNK